MESLATHEPLPATVDSDEGRNTARAADSIRAWLLGDDVQLGDGSEAGGVLGWTSAEGAFVYPEIIGYYLTALAFIASEDPAFASPCRQRAEAALCWLERRDPWPTRVHLVAPQVPDWRNHATFAFDLGMLLGGVSRWCRVASTADRATALRRRIVTELLAVGTHDGVLASHRLHDASRGADVPRTWSTTAGPHHVKVAAHIEAGATADHDGARLLAIGRRTTEVWTTRMHAHAHAEHVHALLYYLEGKLLHATARGETPAWGAIAAGLQRIVAGLTVHGDLRERMDPVAGPRRADITAQTLRLCAAVASRTDDGRVATTLRRASERLCAALREHYLVERGAVLGLPRRADAQPQLNVWASAFTYQALRFHHAVLLGRRVPPRWLALLV